MLYRATLEKSTLGLLKKLQQAPVLGNVRLVGGTALALQLGHRQSVDLDFFGPISVSGSQIVEQLFPLGFEDITIVRDIGAVKVFFIDKIKVDIVSYRYAWLEDAVREDGIVMAGLKDIAAMKLSAVTNRGSKKDFIDVYYLLRHFSIRQMLDFYEQKYYDGSLYNVIRSLTWFADGENDEMPKMTAPISWEHIKETIRLNVHQISL